MKRIPPIVGPAVLEQDDIKQMTEADKIQLMFTYGFIIGSGFTLVLTAVVSAAL